MCCVLTWNSGKSMSKIIRRMTMGLIILEKTRYVQQTSAFRAAPSYAEIINLKGGLGGKNSI